MLLASIDCREYCGCVQGSTTMCGPRARLGMPLGQSTQRQDPDVITTLRLCSLSDIFAPACVSAMSVQCSVAICGQVRICDGFFKKCPLARLGNQLVPVKRCCSKIHDILILPCMELQFPFALHAHTHPMRVLAIAFPPCPQLGRSP